MSSRKIKFGYWVLAVLFAGTIAFQSVLSAEALHHIWASSYNFRPQMLASWDLEFVAHVLTPLACLVLAFYVVAARIWDSRAWLLLAVLVAFSVMSDGTNRHDEAMTWTTPLKHLALVYRSFAIYTFPFWLALFALFFPEQLPWDREHPKWKWLILVPALALCCYAAGLRVVANESSSPRLEAMRDSTGSYWLLVFYLSIVFFIVVLSLKLASAKTPDSRRRVRVLLFGIGLTLVPLASLGAIARTLHISEDDLPAWVLIPIFPLVLSFPITVAYVTVVQRALDLGVVIRQSLQYALARRGVVVVEIFISILVVLIVAEYTVQISFPGRVLLTALGIAAVLLTGKGANSLATWIDRRFFRDAYRADQVLSQLAESVRSMVELAPVLSGVATKIAEALHISQIAVFLCEQSVYRPAFSLGYPSLSGAVLAVNAFTIQELKRKNEPLPVYLDNPRSWAARVTSDEAKLLRELRAQLLLPLSRRDELLGFVSLGSKYSEAPYSANDVNLLQSVASQTALAVENSRLTSAIANEVAEREVIHRELAIAREVQQRLFPQSYPQVPGLEYNGTCRPAQEVGGDYYDFIQLPNGHLGIAIGDVSGKGIPASLLMASLQASLRGQALTPSTSIDRMMENVNQLIYGATPVNRYATFFYAQYDPVLRRLQYVNAGHNAPIVLRNGHSDRECIRLDIGGPPVGLLPQAIYQSAHIDLETKDLFVLFTDGISECMNAADDEWGEHGLLETLHNSAGNCPPAVVHSVFSTADTFAAGAPQHDDMTVVVFRVLEPGSTAANSSVR